MSAFDKMKELGSSLAGKVSPTLLQGLDLTEAGDPLVVREAY